MFDHLQIYDTRERLAVGLADMALKALTLPFRLGRPPAVSSAPARVLVLRLERIGDLLMTFEALATLRASLPGARIDLVVGSWNESLARAMAVADRIETLDAPWLARGGAGDSWTGMVARARAWRRQRYDLAINLEPDIRSNLLIGLSGAPRRVGFHTGGGGACLTQSAAYDPKAHTHANATRLVHLTNPALKRDWSASSAPRLQLPEAARNRARQLLAPAAGTLCIGIHASGGRPVKQWHIDRFAGVATALARDYHATIVLTGTPADAPIVGEVRRLIPDDVKVLDLSGGMDLIDFAAVLEQLALYVTGDTGPMHLAAAVGTPVVAIFGPSDPARYAPLTDRSRIVRIDLPCSPCNRIRLPPERCRGHVPDCLDGISVDRVVSAARELLPAQTETTPGVITVP